VPRDRFVRWRERNRAWENRALPIGEGQTISQPLVVARMCELLRLCPEDRVLDVGTGSGYHAAVLARLCRWVWSVERVEPLSTRAAENLAGVENVTLAVGDGTLGWPDAAPFDAVNVAAATAEIPPALEAQLAPGGRLVAPVGPPNGQRLVLVERTLSGLLTRTEHDRVAFVPLIPPA
jgi:protein-L-isoaspartate(D-aspartate) O-methyltransferase